MSGALEAIEESAYSDTQLSRTASHESSTASGENPPNGNAVDDDDDDEEFVYPGASEEAPTHEEEQPPVVPPKPTQHHASPAQLESIYAAASSGDLSLLKKLFRTAMQTGDVEAFALSNDASTRTGLTALHAAASRGHLDVVQWLVEDCGAIPDVEDKEGETALHKAALHGHLRILTYLLPDRADIHVRDADGWTPLHNACSKGYLDIVRWLCEVGGANSELNGAPGVDVRSKGGWTPLMNAASKGHLPVVLYLLSKQSANPLVRNNWGETAYDAAAAVFEVWICEVLQKAEAERWRLTTVPYDPLAVHTTVPLILYENQRLDARLKTLAVNGGRPRFSASGLGKQGRRAPFELRLPTPDTETRAREIPAWRSDVQLPLLEDPWHLPYGTQRDRASLEGAERSHFWLSDWTLDVTHPSVDADEGWQYARTFSDPDDHWTAEQPPQLVRQLTGNAVVRTPSASSSSSAQPNPQKWVRRRRWVRVMRRRLDVPPLPFLEPDGNMYHLTEDGTLIPYVQESHSDIAEGDGQELGAMPASMLGGAKDYVSRARYLVGNQSQSSESGSTAASALEARRAIAKLERATTELRQGILADTDTERKTQAEVLLHAYSRELERRRLAAGAQGLLISNDDDDLLDGDDSSDEEFHYPGASPTDTAHARPASVHSGTTTRSEYFSRSASISSPRGPADLTPQLAQAPEFRVPTHEAPQKVLTPRWSAPTPHTVHAQWERDEAVSECRDCGRRFTFLLRRHHCRRCGRIFCDRCSSYRLVLDPADIVQDPATALPDAELASASQQRVCASCHSAAGIPTRLQGSRAASMERIVVDQARLSVPAGNHSVDRGMSGSQLSDLAECPVCGQNLDDLGGADAQEAHVKSCLDGDGGSGTGVSQTAKYLVYKLPAESALIGIECVICLEEFTRGSVVARLSCLCSFHNACLTSWLQRGRSCPVHAR